jgi:hypothetical protein
MMQLEEQGTSHTHSRGCIQFMSMLSASTVNHKNDTRNHQMRPRNKIKIKEKGEKCAHRGRLLIVGVKLVEMLGESPVRKLIKQNNAAAVAVDFLEGGVGILDRRTP